MSTIKFERPLLFPPRNGGDAWELAEDWAMEYNGRRYELPAGFETDGASIPRFLWRVCGTPLEVPRLYAALVHDFIYGGGSDSTVSRADADALYRDLLVELGEPRVRAWTEYVALRLFGGGHYYAR